MIPLYCMVCRGEVEPKRAKRGRTCSQQCQSDLANAKRRERAGKKCRLCGHRFPKVQELGYVLGEHTAISAKAGG